MRSRERTQYPRFTQDMEKDMAYKHFSPEPRREADARVAADRGILAIASERKVGYLIHSTRWGTFLRQVYGVPFWSKVNPEGIDEAQVFAGAESAQQILRTLQIGHDCELRRVDVHHTADTASIDDCVAAGIPRWDPSSLSSGAPADNSSTPGTLDGPPAQYH
jgi:hypothetical protein